jgi:hypothetical protein
MSGVRSLSTTPLISYSLKICGLISMEAPFDSRRKAGSVNELLKLGLNLNHNLNLRLIM